MTAADRCILQQASWRARLLVSTGSIKSDDWEDLRQEMVVDCLRRSPKFNPSRGDWRGFVRGVILHRSTELLRNDRVRRYRELLADDLVQPEHGRDATESAADIFAAVDQTPQLIVRMDVRRVLQPLPARLRLLATLLVAGYQVGEIAVRVGRSRSSVHRQTQQIRQAFARAGLGPHRPEQGQIGPCPNLGKAGV
jgi:RNA polymerase sigma-70 factor, ECF subfamily